MAPKFEMEEYYITLKIANAVSIIQLKICFRVFIFIIATTTFQFHPPKHTLSCFRNIAGSTSIHSKPREQVLCSIRTFCALIISFAIRLQTPITPVCSMSCGRNRARLTRVVPTIISIGISITALTVIVLTTITLIIPMRPLHTVRRMVSPILPVGIGVGILPSRVLVTTVHGVGGVARVMAII